MLYIGDDNLDWRTAINGPIFYLHAKWSKQRPAGQTTFEIDSPFDAWDFIGPFLYRPARFACRLDDDTVSLRLRSLLPASTVLAGDTPSQEFNLRDVLTYRQTVTVGGYSARDLLILHALSSLMLEGGITRNPRFTVYPSSTPGKFNGPIADYLAPLSRIFHGFYRDDLLVRVKQARDTSLARFRARQAGVDANVTIEDQMRTVCVGDAYRGKLQGKHVIVFDDFTTTGASLEWARNLLFAAGADRVTLMTIGKYGTTYNVHRLRPEVNIDPFTMEERPINEVFEVSTSYVYPDLGSIALAQEAFAIHQKPKQ
jgi:hypothetical protein